MKVLICEKCQLIHSENFDGSICRNEDCGGKLIPVNIDFTRVEGGDHNTPDEDEPQIAS